MSAESAEYVVSVVRSWQNWGNWNEAQRAILEDIIYHLEQAERVRELEEDYEYLSHYYGLETEQNKRYREALELIKLKTLDIKGDKDTRPFQIYGIASEALEGTE